MRKLLLLIFVISITSSCSLFKRKTDLLTDHEWLLYQITIAREKGTPTVKYPKKFNTSRFKFEKDGVLKVSIDGKTYQQIHWKWYKKDEIIIIDYGDNFRRLYEIEKLTSETFKWKMVKFKYGLLSIEEFKTENSKDWKNRR
jgi:hypothetical protein